jgi:hypothetical protein
MNRFEHSQFAAAVRGTRLIAIIALTVLIAACAPKDWRAGTSLSGTDATWPADWRFTDATKEIQIQVQTPFLIPHSVTIWCAEVDGDLYVGASAPKKKWWPGWVDRDPNVRLSIDDKIYSAHLVPLDDPDTTARVRAAYATKYQLNAAAGAAMGEVRYWHVVAPSGASS